MYIQRKHGSAMDMFLFFALIGILCIMIAVMFPMDDVVFWSIMSVAISLQAFFIFYFGYQLFSTKTISLWEDCEH